MHLIAGAWFAVTAFVCTVIIFALDEGRFKGRGTLAIIPRAIWQSAIDVFDKDLLYSPLILLSALFGSLLVGLTLHVPKLRSQVVAAVFGFLAGLASGIGFVITLAGIHATNDVYHPRLKTFIYFTLYLGMIWSSITVVLAVTYGVSAWLLYRAKMLAESIRSAAGAQFQ